MKIHKLLAPLFIFVSSFLYSCSCEDVYMGEIMPTGELNNFLPDINKRDGYRLSHNNKTIVMGYNLQNHSEVRVPVRETGKSGTVGKGATYDCIEYFTMHDKEYLSYSASGLPVLIHVKQTKNVSPEGFTQIGPEDKVEDVVQFTVGFNNLFPAPVARGMSNYSNYTTYRYFTLSKNPAKLINKRNSFTQELLASVTLNGVVHQNVYHLSLKAPQYTEDEKYFNNSYPLDYIQGIYIKEGIGVIQAYTADGQKVDIRME